MTTSNDSKIWPMLMSRARIGSSGSVSAPTPRDPVRSDFERDWDRILFCAAFRRMHDKTQVFPLPEDDVIHSRLTHSLEVAAVGRSLGKTVGRAICERHAVASEVFDFHDVGDVVAAACLAHDIGNPPFGHAGEDAIASYFRSPDGSTAILALTPHQRADLEGFEGNAQGFRLVTRLQQEADGGLHLTAATLAAFSKYPRESGSELKDDAIASAKKHGVFQEDVHIMNAVAASTGMPPRATGAGSAWSRHPLAYLVEASDDICYSILDIEDGFRLGLVHQAEAEELLRPLAVQALGFSEQRFAGFGKSRKARVGYLRAMAIARLLHEVTECFLDNEPAILDGHHTQAMADIIASRTLLKALTSFARSSCYKAQGVLEIELAGYEALGGLLNHFVPAVLYEDSDEKGRPHRERKTRALLGKHMDLPVGDLYGRILRVTDYVSGMTDRHALATYRRLHGIALPGRAG